jgi:hypothetical protein
MAQGVVTRVAVEVGEVVGWDEAEGTDGGEQARLPLVQLDEAAADLYRLAVFSPREVEATGREVLRLPRPTVSTDRGSRERPLSGTALLRSSLRGSRDIELGGLPELGTRARANPRRRDVSWTRGEDDSELNVCPSENLTVTVGQLEEVSLSRQWIGRCGAVTGTEREPHGLGHRGLSPAGCSLAPPRG